MTLSAAEQTVQKQRVQLHEQLFGTLYKMIQAVRIHNNNNQVVLRCAEDLIQSINSFGADDDRLRIRINSGRFYLQEEKLLIRRQAANLFHNALEYFEKRQLCGLSLATDITSEHQLDLLAFARLLNQSETQKHPAEWLDHQLQEHDFDWIEILPESPDPEQHRPGQIESAQLAPASDGQQQEIARVEAGKSAYVFSLTALKEIGEKVVGNRPSGIRKALRTV